VARGWAWGGSDAVSGPGGGGSSAGPWLVGPHGRERKGGGDSWRRRLVRQGEGAARLLGP
jgi:hypothetical protein